MNRMTEREGKIRFLGYVNSVPLRVCARVFGVSIPTVKRWRAGTSVPRPEMVAIAVSLSECGGA